MKKYKLPILLIFLMLSACKVENQIEDSLNIYHEVYSESRLMLEEKYRIELDLDDHQISSFFVTSEEEIFVFDNTFGLIYKIDKHGQTISSTGGIGRGPGEFVTDYHLNLTYCGADTFFAFDWSQARFQVYDLDLKLLNVVSLNSIPFDLSCVETGKLAVLYSYIPKIDIITVEGSLQEEILPNVVFDTTKESVARHFTYLRKNFYALSYMFKPVLLMISREDRSHKEIILSKLDFNDVSSAVLRVSVLENELHLFYNNINRDIPDREYKISHVFSMDNGKYLYSYRVPEQINLYQFISNNSLAAMEDTMKTVTLYDFKIDHNEQH